jgi:hypothetical protein
MQKNWVVFIGGLILLVQYSSATDCKKAIIQAITNLESHTNPESPVLLGFDDSPPASFPGELLGDESHFKVAGHWIPEIETNKAIESWSAHIVGIPTERLRRQPQLLVALPDTVYRGMSLSPAGVRNILKNGIRPMATKRDPRAPSFDRVFTTSFPKAAFEYIMTGLHSRPNERQYAVLFELAKKSPNHENAPLAGYYKNSKITGPRAEIEYDGEWLHEVIYPDQIKRVFFADPTAAGSEFPFREYSLEQLEKHFGIKPSQKRDPVINSARHLDKKAIELGTEKGHPNKYRADMKLLARIEQKQEASEDLTEEELRFLYETDSKIQVMLYNEEARIESLLKKRDRRKDLGTIFRVKPEEIALTKEEALSGTKKIYLGDLDLSDLKSVEGLTLPEVVYGNIKLGNLKSADKLKLPKVVHGSLDLGSLKSAAGLEFPEVVHGNLLLFDLTNAKGVKLPKEVHGGLNLGSLTNAEGVTLPEVVGSDLRLTSLTSAKGLKLPKEVHGSLFLNRLTSAEGLTLPDVVSGRIDLSGLVSNQGLILPIKFKGRVTLPEGIEAHWTD